MSVLALDIGRFTGWALRHSDDSVTSGTWDLKTRGEKYPCCDLLDRLSQIAVDELELVAFEEPQGGFMVTGANGKKTPRSDIDRQFGEYIGIIKAWCRMHGLGLISVHPGTLKKHATGHGAAKKPAMKARAKELFPCQEVHNDHQADALCALNWAEEQVLERAKSPISAFS